MNVKRIIIISLVAVAALALIKLVPLAWMFTAGLRTPVEVPEPDYWPTEGWRTSIPEEQGYDSAKMAQGLLALQENQVNIDSLMIIRNGYVVLDAYFDPYDGTFPHDLASVTKSVMTTLIGIAADQRVIDLDQPVVSFFPQRTIANLDDNKSQMTVRHLVSMVNGMESGCYDNDAPTLQAMRANPDWVQSALDRPMVSEPGMEFCYDSPGMHLLSAILQEATGMTALDFARQYLFEPLGIHDVIWEVDPQGYSRGWGDLHLLPEDLAKIGFLWLHRGNWDGQQIVSEEWVLESVKAHSKFIEPDFGYGYGWWISSADYQATGRGGQRVRVIATLNMLVVVTGGDADYAAIESWLVPMLLQSKDVLPANPAGVNALEAALASVGQGKPVWTVRYIPETSGLISGNTYLCETNPAGIETIGLAFNDADEATIFMKMDGIDHILPVGLDGSYHLGIDGTGFRGYWGDAQTFNLEVFDIGLTSRQAVFIGDSLNLTLPEVDLTIACQAQDV